MKPFYRRKAYYHKRLALNDESPCAGFHITFSY